MKTNNESQLLHAVMQELGKYGAIFRTNSGSVRLANGKYFKAMPEGFSDLLFIRPDGVPCFVELKSGRNKLSDKQQELLIKCG